MNTEATSTPTCSTELDLGRIRPRGWLHNQLRLQADGLTGRLEDIWPDVGPDSSWKGGAGEDWERGPYYLDGLIPLAHVLNDEHLQELAQPWIDWILNSQDDSGFFGPSSNTDWWPRIVALKALTQHADATGDERVPDFLENYFRYQLRELPARPLEGWARVRGNDNTLSVWWLHNRLRESWLLDLVDLLTEQTADWLDYLNNGLITGPAQSFDWFTHGPNVAMGLKQGALATLRDGNVEHQHATDTAFATLTRWHGQVHGFFSGDEWLAGPAPTAGVETCQVVELMFTLETLARVLPHGRYGDMLESAAYNLLAAACDPHMLAHQYHQQANQVRVSVGRRSWTYSHDDANIFGLEPHFGCCTANLHQGWPKLVRSAWVRDPDGALRVIAYGPMEITEVVEGHDVRLVVDTHYPFDDRIGIEVHDAPPTAVALRLRIPHWTDSPTIHIAGEPVTLDDVHDGYVTIRRSWTAGDRVDIHLPMTPRLTHRAQQAIGVTLGPLTMALSPGENWIPVADAPGLGEWEIRPRTSWNHGLLIPNAPDAWTVHRQPPNSVPFSSKEVPVTISVEGALAREWALHGPESGPLPTSPLKERGPIQQLTLVPYGTARLRVTEFPTVSRNGEEF